MNHLENKPTHATQLIRQNVPTIINANFTTPLDDHHYLFENAQCFRHERELSNAPFKEKSKTNDKFQIFNQILYGCHMPPYYSVLNFKLMEKLIGYLQNPKSMSKLLLPYKDIIKHEQELFGHWLSTVWEENLKSRRLDSIISIENYIKSACDFSNSYIKSNYGETYRSKMKIDYNREEDQVTNKIEMTYCKKIKASEVHHTLKLPPSINIANVESKISFTDVEYNPPLKFPFVQDELCQELSNKHSSDVNICLSSLKRIMHLEKSNSLWLIPVNINIDSNNRKTINIGSTPHSGYFSQEEKSLYCLRKEIKKKFRCRQSTGAIGAQQNMVHNYENWTLKVNNANSDEIKTFNLLVRNKPHIKAVKNKCGNIFDSVLIPKIEYQPEYGFEKISDDQLVEYWLDTYFRSPSTRYNLVSVQYNMDIMMIKRNKIISEELISEEKKQMFLQRLYLTLDTFSQLDQGEYVMLHNPKKPFQVDVYQSCQYGGFNLLNMYFVLQQTEITNLLTWNPIDAEVVCPIHEHFKVAPCMFRPNPTLFNVQVLSEQVDKYKAVLDDREKLNKQREANRRNIKKQKNRAKQQLKRQENLYDVKRKVLKTFCD